jgi:integrase
LRIAGTYVVIGLFTGLRSSEIEKLDWNQISLVNKRI